MGIIIDGKEYYGIIYKIENIVNHKVYIGQTTNPRGFNGRYSCDGVGAERVYRRMWYEEQRGVPHNTHLYRALEKYGANNFVVDEVYDTAMTAKELNEKEMHYVAKFDSYNNGYNMSIGGDNALGMTGRLCHNSKRLYQLSLDGEFIRAWDCGTEASDILGITASSISLVCKYNSLDETKHKGRRAKTAGGFVWVLEKDYDPNKNYARTRQKKDMGKGTRPVLLLADDNITILREFYSVNSAGAELGISGQEVSRICLHKAKTIKFNLMYKDEYMEEQRLSVRGSYEIAS